MYEMLSELLAEEGIDLVGALPLGSCHIVRPYLLEREGIKDGTVFPFVIPYYSSVCREPHNLSVYAVPRDYHGFLTELSARLLPKLKSAFPENRFALFGDHSPIHEQHAAACAGLGVVGDNRMLLTEKYSSYVFLAEVVTDAVIDCTPHAVGHCPSCGRCKNACEFLRGEEPECLSYMTQKKGVLTNAEIRRMVQHGTVWGCDRCQEVCPFTARAKHAGTIYTRIPYFTEQTVPYLTSKAVSEMSDAQFTARAFSWRGRDTILRNLEAVEQYRQNHKEDTNEC